MMARTLLAASTLLLPHVNYTAIMPELIVLGGSLLLLAVSAVTPRRLPTTVYAAMTSGIGIAALVASLVLYHDVRQGGAFVAIAHSIDVDGFSVLVMTLASCVLILTPMLAAGFFERERLGGCEYYALACISVGGAMLMGAANDLVLIFLALEVLSIPLYVMAGLDYRREGSGEAALKYFLLGAFSSAIFVYGIALVYGATGSTNLGEIAAFLSHNVLVANGVLYGGMALLIVGFSFKIAAVPFHMWTPDVYQGSPTPAVGFMASIAKVGGFAAFLRVFISSFPTLSQTWKPVLWVIVIITVLVGAIAALVQRNVKRMLAYSSINHAGFILLGLQAATARGAAGSLYYLFAYSLLVLGSFGVVAVVGGRGDSGHSIERYRGLGRRSPLLAGAFALLLLAQAGAPFTTGFFAKLYVVEAAVAAHSYALAIVAMVSAAIAAFFYLRVVFVMFGDVRPVPAPAGDAALVAAGEPALVATAVPHAGLLEPAAGASGGLLLAEAPVLVEQDAATVEPSTDEEVRDGIVSAWTWAGLILTVGATVVFGIWPQPLVDFAQHAHLLF